VIDFLLYKEQYEARKLEQRRHMLVYLTMPDYLEHTAFTENATQREDFKTIGELVEAYSKKTSFFLKDAVGYLLDINPKVEVQSHYRHEDSNLRASLKFILGKRAGRKDISGGRSSPTLFLGDHLVVMFIHEDSLMAVDVYEITGEIVLRTAYDWGLF
jgi:hypothetical protein